MQIDVLHYITLRYITLHYNAPVGKKSPTVDRPRFWLQRISSSRADSKSPAISNQTRTISLSTHLINSKQLCIQPRTSALSAPLPAFAAERRAAGCSRLQLLRGAASCRPISPASHGAQLQTRRTPQLLSIDGTDRQTDGRTDDRFLSTLPRILCAGRECQ